jgi:hypothetical protein
MKNLKENIMSDIENIKEELAMKYMAGTLAEEDNRGLPKNDELRTFVCSLGSFWAYYYARHIDKSPTEETRVAVCKDPWDAYEYAQNVDKKPTEETRTASCKEPYAAYCYALLIDKKPSEETRAAAYGSCYYQEKYQEFEKIYYAKHRKN